MQGSSRNLVVRRRQRGFALLIVFLLAAAIAIMLYRQIPRVAFESQRDKEELLIERGEQYKRAIQLYYIAFKKYPSKVEDLESTNDKRFLRRRYVDPMTGKDEWRLIHVNAAGVLTDSLVQKPAAPGAPGAPGTSGAPGTPGANGSPGTATTVTGIIPATGAGPSVGAGPGTGSGTTAGSGASGASDTTGPPEVNAAVLRRPSDRPLVPGSLTGSAPGTNPANIDPDDPRYWPPITLLPSGPSGAPGSPGQPGSNPVQGINPQVPGQPIPGQQIPGQSFPGQTFPTQQSPTQTGQPFPAQQFPAQQFPTPTSQPIPGLPGTFSGLTPPQGSGITNQPASTMNQSGTIATGVNPTAPPNAQNAALNMINTMLTTPRQTPPTPDSSATNPGNAGGLAGVASTFKGPSIKIYHDRQKYNEWEFIFDLKQGLPGQPAPPANPGQTNASGINNPGGAINPGASPGQTNSGAGFGTGSGYSLPLSPSPSSPPAQQ